MLATPIPSPSEIVGNAAFEALLWALSRPGQARILPQPGETAIIAALLDRECLVYSADPLLLPEIMRTGAEVANIAEADHVFLGALTTSDPLAQVSIGIDLYPDDGATVIVRARVGAGPEMRLTGPGIDSDVVIRLGGLPDGFWAARAARRRYPMGFDLFILDGARIVGVPRSTEVEAL